MGPAIIADVRAWSLEADLPDSFLIANNATQEYLRRLARIGLLLNLGES